jgi:tRNA (guanosine-2'-O-)-methyltransferase
MGHKESTDLSGIVTEQRRRRIEQVLDWRTYHVAVVLEDIYQSQNASATIRTAECFGIQRLFTIENRNPLSLNRDVVVGADKWIDIERFNKSSTDNTAACAARLRELGYRVVATALSEGASPIRELDVDTPVALLFGTELTGLSDGALALADDIVKLPMFGFTESYNISVSVALALSEVMQRLHRSQVAWRLTETERDALRQRWLAQQLKRQSKGSRWRGVLPRPREQGADD